MGRGNCPFKAADLRDAWDSASKTRIVKDMYERHVIAGDILIQEGDTGAASCELYVVKSGEF
eukprot:jgi/Botrbrau1/18757/Bobra.0386s0080.1